jgi:hypothetical protein
MNALGRFETMDESSGSIIDEERIRDAVSLCKNMRNNGASLEAIENRLANRGFDAMAIKAVMQHIPVKEPDNIIVNREFQKRGNVALVVVGLMFCALGAFLVIGNRTGMAPTLPFMGFFFMVIGAVIMAAGRF